MRGLGIGLARKNTSPAATPRSTMISALWASLALAPSCVGYPTVVTKHTSVACGCRSCASTARRLYRSSFREPSCRLTWKVRTGIAALRKGKLERRNIALARVSLISCVLKSVWCSEIATGLPAQKTCLSATLLLFCCLALFGQKSRG